MTEKIQNPRKHASFISCCTFAWFTPTIIKGYHKQLTEEDLFEILDSEKSSYLGDLLEDAWKKECIRPNPSLIRAIWNVFRSNFTLYILIAALTELVFKTGQCLAFLALLKYYSQETHVVTKPEAYIYASLLTICSFAAVVGQHQCMYNYRLLGMKVRVACCSLIYRKSLKMNKCSMGEINIGRIVNLITNDVNRFDYIAPLINNLWLCPIQIVVVMVILYFNTGWTGIVGILIFILIIPIQLLIGKKLTVLRRQTAKITDDRIQIMSEIISGIKTIKMLTWEKPMTSLIKKTRHLEIKKLRCTALLLALLMIFMNCLPKLGLFASILVYACMGFELTPVYVFGLVVFYNMLKLPLNKFFPQAFFRWGETTVAIKRIQEFLQNPETPKLSYPPNDTAKKPEIKIKNLSAKWDLNEKESVLRNINLDITEPKIVAIIGSVGSGKSSLISLMLKELSLINGEIYINGIISYSSQIPCFFRGTIKENILFNQQYDEKRYKSVIKACALDTDLLSIPKGDKTVIIEDGTNLSGGQKARINLARAMYKVADIYLIDDPLSSLDMNVAESILVECISFFKSKHVVVVLNQLQLLRYFDYIYTLQDGELIAEGTYADLQNNGLDLLKFSTKIIDESRTERISNVNNSTSKCDDDEIKEGRDVGAVDFMVYKKYFKAGGKIYVHILLLLITIIFVGSCSVFDAGIGYWSNIDNKLVNVNSTETHLTRQQYIIDLSSIMVIIIITAGISATAYYILLIRCSENLHNDIFENVIAAPMQFFYLNPSGRILNRFSKDLGLMDDYLHTVVIDTIMITLVVVGVFLIKAIINYWLCVVMIFLIILFCVIRKIYLPTIVAVKRLEGVTKSPICAHVKTTIEGLVTIRAFRNEIDYKTTFDNLQDFHTSSWFMYLSSVFTYRFLIDTLGVILIGTVTFSFFLLGDSYAGTAGLAITQSMMLVSVLQWCIRQSCEVTVTMTSVERITEYLNMKTENHLANRNAVVRETWPEYGNIEFQNVTMRYKQLGNPILKDINFKIKSKQRIGIIGRTGAGKSSLCSALFQLGYIDGSIIIDDINIASVPLQNLRAKLSVIPQEPFLFSDTIRKNLDPFQKIDDAHLWKVLEEVRLKKVVANMREGLSTKISEGDFSVGQRQLFCLARAMLTKNKILIIDEVAANVDSNTDALIQSTIREKFDNNTVLIIAHRLHTAIDCDVILVMDDGRIVEHGHPFILLEKKEIFFDLVRKTGETTCRSLHEIAKNRYNDVMKNKS